MRQIVENCWTRQNLTFWWPLATWPLTWLKNAQSRFVMIFYAFSNAACRVWLCGPGAEREVRFYTLVTQNVTGALSNFFHHNIVWIFLSLYRDIVASQSLAAVSSTMQGRSHPDAERRFAPPAMFLTLHSWYLPLPWWDLIITRPVRYYATIPKCPFLILTNNYAKKGAEQTLSRHGARLAKPCGMPFFII